MQVIYTITGGAWLADSLNAVAVLTASSTWSTLMKWAAILSVLAVVWSWLQRRDVISMIKWVAVIVIVPGVLVGVRQSVQVIDITDQTSVNQVDNVPAGLVIPASLITSVGYALVQGYDNVFHRPDAVSYTKTGMLFGSELVSASTDFAFTDGEIASLFSDYVKSCVIGDIFLNHKYSMEELMTTTDPYSLIFSKPSPLRGVFDKTGTFQTCQVAAATLQQSIGTDASAGGNTFTFWAQKLLGTRTNRDQLFASLMGDSYNYFYGAGSSASEIVKQNVAMNGLRRGISAFAARNGSTASMLNIATETASEKQIMQQSVSANIAMKYLPMMQTILLGLMIGLFPVLVVLAIINTLTWPVLKGYILTLAWLQTWPLLFAVLNNAMTFYLKAGGAYDVTLANLSQVQQQHAMMASTAGWLSIFIPVISGGMVKGLSSVMSQVGSSLAALTQGVASQSSSQAVDGTYAFNNMQTDNVQGFKWDTNSTFSDGRRDRQLANGAMDGTAPDGTKIVNSATGTSKLPMDVNFGRSMSSSAQRLARESQVQAESSLQGFNHAMNSAFNQAQQFTQKHGNSDTVGQGTNNSQTAQASQALGKLVSAVSDHAKKNGMSFQQSWTELESKSKGLEGYASGSVGGGWKIIKGEVGVKGSVKTGSQSSADHRESGSQDYTSSSDAREVRDFKDGVQVLQNYAVSHRADHNDNSSASQLEQIGTSLNEADSHYQQYTSSMSRSHEYSKVASMSESETAQQNSNLSQEFVGYVQQHAPDRADDILTNSSDEQIRQEREALANDFVDEKLRSRIECNFDASRAGLSEGMQGVANDVGDHSEAMMKAGYAAMARKLQEAGIKEDTRQEVASTLQHNNDKISQTSAEIEQGHDAVQHESDRLKDEHGKAKDNFVNNYNKASEHQKLSDLRNNPGDISEVAKRLKEDRGAND